MMMMMTMTIKTRSPLVEDNPFHRRYKVAFSSTGLVQAVEVDLYNNAGHTMDLSFSVMERAMFHSDGSYKVPNLRARGHCCKTNLPSNTAFRGFGGPQGLMVAESWIEKIAMKLSLSTEEVRQRNLYKEGELTHFNQQLVNCTLSRCWDECSKMAGFSQLRAEVDEFNANNRWKKRGLAMIPVKFGIAFTAVHLNQNGALINVYTDGSVLISWSSQRYSLLFQDGIGGTRWHRDGPGSTYEDGPGCSAYSWD